MLKIGLIGCGMIAERGHMPAIQKTPGLQLYAVYDVDFKRAKYLQRKFSVPHAYPTEEEFFGSDVDAIVVCTPAPVHHANVLSAARAGKSVLCEKPLAMTEADMIEMIETMDDAGLQLFTAFNYRFSDSAYEIRRLVREQAVGEVRALRLIYNWNLHGVEWDEEGKRVDSSLRVGRMKEGGPLVDCGVHQIDLARWWLASDVVWQRGIGVWVEDYDAPDHVYLHMGHECGAHTMVEVSFSYNATSKEPRSVFLYELIGTDGVIRYSREEHTFEVRNSRGTQFLAWHAEKSFVGIYDELARALKSGRPGDMPTGRDGLAASRIAQAATEQAIHDREDPSRAHPSTMRRAIEVQLPTEEILADYLDLPLDPAWAA